MDGDVEALLLGHGGAVLLGDRLGELLALGLGRLQEQFDQGMRMQHDCRQPLPCGISSWGPSWTPGMGIVIE